LPGKNAVSPIMREQTNFAIIFKTRTRRTLENLYESYGGLFPKLRDFSEHLDRATHQKYTAMLYSEAIVEGQNYISIQAPKDYPRLTFKF
jgi:hypothetical protein